MEPEQLTFLLTTLLFAGGLSLYVVSLVLRNRAWDRFAQAYQLQKAIGPDNLLGVLLDQPKVTGAIEGRMLSMWVESRGHRSKHRVTVLQLQLGGGVSYGLSLTRERLFQKLGKLFGREDQQVGERDLDRLFIIEGMNERDRRILADPRVVEALRTLVGTFSNATLRHGMVVLEQYGHVGSKRLLEKMFHRANAVALAIDAAAKAPELRAAAR